ncbi:MAG TPA: glycosyltransferase 87 family protein [Acidimicrobiales bacterium]|jgi:hypothetical protein|nr:glycosyltransferase 87 family protein [Acidimicrobiales bacterium]
MGLARPWLSRVALAVAALAMATVLVRGPDGGTGTDLVLLVVAFVALGVMVVAERRERHLGRGLVLGVSSALLVLAVVVPPTESGDVWSYAMYGRMVATYHDNPYRHTPAEFRADPIGRRVPAYWVGSRSVYGPLFTAVSAAGMAGAGHSPLAARLFFQGLAAAAVAGALLLIDRRTRDPVALAVIGVNPIIVISVVNGAHNDALVGLAVLGGVLLVCARRPAWAGAALAAAALVKVSALLPLAAVAVWVWRHHGRREATALGATAAAVGLAGLVAAGASSVVAALGDAQGRVNGGSIWAGPRRWLADSGSSLAGGRGLSWLAVAVAIALTVALVRRRDADDGPFLAAGAAVVAYLLVGTYVLPWYLAWGLPVLAVVWRWRLGWLVMAQAAVLQLATARAPAIGATDALSTGSAVGRFQLDLYTVGAPMLELALILVVIVALLSRVAANRERSVQATAPTRLSRG